MNHISKQIYLGYARRAGIFSGGTITTAAWFEKKGMESMRKAFQAPNDDKNYDHAKDAEFWFNCARVQRDLDNGKQ